MLNLNLHDRFAVNWDTSPQQQKPKTCWRRRKGIRLTSVSAETIGSCSKGIGYENVVLSHP